MDAAVIGLVSLCVTSATALGLAFIAFKTTSLTRKVDEVKKNTDGLTSALVTKTEQASHAEGKLEGMAEEKAGAATATVPPQPM